MAHFTVLRYKGMKIIGDYDSRRGVTITNKTNVTVRTALLMGDSEDTLDKSTIKYCKAGDTVGYKPRLRHKKVVLLTGTSDSTNKPEDFVITE